MKTKKYKILVLSDLKGNTESLLKNSFSIADKIGGSIEFFHVKTPLQLVESDNQLSAMRQLNRQQVTSRNNTNNLLKKYTELMNIDATATYTLGKVKKEIKKKIEQTKPDLIVLGKRRTNFLKVVGDSITEFVLKSYDGPVFISSYALVIEPHKQLSLGVFDDRIDAMNLSFAEHILAGAGSTIKTFSIGNKKESTQEPSNPKTKEEVAYVFENTADVMKSVSSYVDKSRINLLWVNRNRTKNGRMKELKQLLSNASVSILVSS